MNRMDQFIKTQKAKKEKEEKMKILIEAALGRFDADELLQMLYDVSSSYERSDLHSKMIDMTTEDGSIYIKVDNMVKRDQLTNFITTEIYPCYNEQQNLLFVA